MADNPPPKSAIAKVTLTPREQEVLVAALRNLKENSEIEVSPKMRTDFSVYVFSIPSQILITVHMSLLFFFSFCLTSS
jgi:hypothetical protein